MSSHVFSAICLQPRKLHFCCVFCPGTRKHSGKRYGAQRIWHGLGHLLRQWPLPGSWRTTCFPYGTEIAVSSGSLGCILNCLWYSILAPAICCFEPPVRLPSRNDTDCAEVRKHLIWIHIVQNRPAPLISTLYSARPHPLPPKPRSIISTYPCMCLRPGRSMATSLKLWKSAPAPFLFR